MICFMHRARSRSGQVFRRVNIQQSQMKWIWNAKQSVRFLFLLAIDGRTMVDDSRFVSRFFSSKLPTKGFDFTYDVIVFALLQKWWLGRVNCLTRYSQGQPLPATSKSAQSSSIVNFIDFWNNSNDNCLGSIRSNECQSIRLLLNVHSSAWIARWLWSDWRESVQVLCPSAQICTSLQFPFACKINRVNATPNVDAILSIYCVAHDFLFTICAHLGSSVDIFCVFWFDFFFCSVQKIIPNFWISKCAPYLHYPVRNKPINKQIFLW